MQVNLYSLHLVKDKTFAIRDCSSANAAAKVIEALIADAPNEHMVGVFLDAKNQMIGATVFAQGGQQGLNLVARDVFRAAIVAQASGIVLGHNHPSGDTKPSREDIITTHRLVEAGKLIGCPVVDHVIVGLDAQYWSMMEHNTVQFCSPWLVG